MKIIFSFFVFITSLFLWGQNFQLQLNQNWKFISLDNPKESLSAKVPGTVHTDLFENGLIPHPLIGDNEKDLQWISEKNWLYETRFELTKEQLEKPYIDLVFEGLDTYANVYLNDRLILEAHNAFRIWKSDVKKLLKKKNKLKIEFIPTKIIEEQKKKEIPYELPEGNRIFTRKAQFQYGWDWGPKYNTMGIWRPVYLEFWNDVKMEDLYVRTGQLGKNEAFLELEYQLKSNQHTEILSEIFLNNDKVYTIQHKINKGSLTFKVALKIDHPKLWWTHNLGEPYLYEFKVELKDLEGNLLDEKIVKKGLRTIELITEKDEHGESFYFKLNGVPVYMKGANYIPQNSFQNWVADEDYEKLLTDVVDSNMNMLRVWGGGIYENDRFYELCDEKGILVWQDFMFACAMYPGDVAFLENVKQEAIDNVKRLRNHSSIALWCGNNESSEGWHKWGWQEGRSEEEKAEIWVNYQKLFNGILPEIVKEYTDLPYWESSPKFGRGDERYLSEGDAHDWWIWHDGKPFEDLETKRPRFMSEFGFQSFPSLEVVKFINNGNSTSISSEEFKNHQKHSRGFDIIKTYMERDFPVPTNEEDYMYVSQILQAYGIGKGIEAQRRNKPYTMGSLYWQLNDCWPAVSWSGIDSFGNWKALQYQVQHSFADVLVSFEREGDKLKVFVVNDKNEDLNGLLNVDIEKFDGSILDGFAPRIRVEKNSVYKEFELDLTPYLKYKDEIYISVYLSKHQKSLYYLSNPKNLKLSSDPIQNIYINERPTKDGFDIYLLADDLKKNVFLSTNVKGSFSDNYFDLLPGKAYVIHFKTDTKEFKLEDLKIKSLNDLVNLR